VRKKNWAQRKPQNLWVKSIHNAKDLNEGATAKKAEENWSSYEWKLIAVKNKRKRWSDTKIKCMRGKNGTKKNKKAPCKDASDTKKWENTKPSYEERKKMKKKAQQNTFHYAWTLANETARENTSTGTLGNIYPKKNEKKTSPEWITKHHMHFQMS